MKYLLTGLALFEFVAMGCKDTKTNEEAQIDEELKMEIEESDSAAAQIDSVQQAIDSASENLDELLNELDQ